MKEQYAVQPTKMKISVNDEPPFNISGTFEKLLRTILVELEDISENK